jgi:hypothetical protein
MVLCGPRVVFDESRRSLPLRVSQMHRFLPSIRMVDVDMQEKWEVPSRKTLTNKIWIKKKYITTFANV